MMPAIEEVRIERAVYGGAGLTRTVAGAVTFVPFVLPGEFVTIQVDSPTKDAHLVHVIEPSSSRATPRCPHFGKCGGCHYQHAAYPAQLTMKHAVLLETMQRAGVDNLPSIDVHSSHPWEYRNRTRFRIAVVDGQFRLGYNVRGTNEVLPISECPITAGLLWKAASALLHIAQDGSEARSWLTAANEVEFFANDDLSRLQMTLTCSGMTPAKKGSFTRICEALQREVPELTGAGVVIAEPKAASPRSLETWGAAGLAYRVADETYWISRGGFFQVNRFLIGDLVQLVCEGRSGGIAWDLFAGVGLFSRILAKSFAQITAVEANPSAATDLQAALAKLSRNHRAIQSSTLAFLRSAIVQRERPDLVILDPPRAGAGVEVCDLLLRLQPSEMLYVSCDPVTLARDLVHLQNGYRIAAMHMVDLFPQTFHMETVVVLQRK
jgi:23S rRNA (uracil1939-C5)-methyltransferase